MSKTTILVMSIISMLLTAVYNVLPLSPSFSAILFLLLVLAWIVTVVVVFGDVKRRGKSQIFTGLTLFFGGFGSLIYYFTIRKEENEPSGQPAPMSESSRKNMVIFSSIMAVIFGFAFVITLPIWPDSYLSLPQTLTWGILLAVSIGIIIYGMKKKNA